MVQLKYSLLLSTVSNKPVKSCSWNNYVKNFLTIQYLRARIICSLWQRPTLIFYGRLTPPIAIWILYKLNIFVYVQLLSFKWCLFEIMAAVGYIKNCLPYWEILFFGVIMPLHKPPAGRGAFDSTFHLASSPVCSELQCSGRISNEAAYSVF